MRIKPLLFFSIFFISPVVLAQKYSKDKKKFVKEKYCEKKYCQKKDE